MNKEEIEQLINSLTSIVNGEMEIDALKKKINPDYIDSNGNGCFHFLLEYSFEQFCLKNIKLSQDQDIVKVENYNEIKSKYINCITSFINILLSLNCNVLTKNNPLILGIKKKNYIISKEYFKIQHNLDILNDDQYNDILNLIINNGNCFDKDCIELTSNILSTVNENSKTNIFNKQLLNKENKEYELTPLISLCKNFSENIYDRYNQLVKIKSMEYINKDNNNNINVNPLDQNVINDIKKKSYEEINNYLNNYFYPLIINFIELGADIFYYENKSKSNRTSGFMYLMKYPFIQDLSKFINENKININYQDYSGNTALIYLINNKENIIQISKDIYYNVFNILINDKNIQIEKMNNNGESAFYSCLIKGYYDEAKIIYEKFKNLHILNFYSDILIFIINSLYKYKSIDEIVNLFKFFKDDININEFNTENHRSLLHYIFLYLSDDKSINTNLFQKVFLLLMELKIDITKKDQFNRNALFYLFLGENDKIKIIDPYNELKYFLNNYKFGDLNDVDVFGNSLLLYALQSEAMNSVKILIEHGIAFNNFQPKNENSIYSLVLSRGEIKLFRDLYNMNKDANIFGHKIYEQYKIKENENIINNNENEEKGETLYDYLNKGIIKSNNSKKISNLNIIFNNDINKNKNNKFNMNKNNVNNEFNYFNFLSDDVLKVLNEYTKNLIIKINNNNNSINIINNIHEDKTRNNNITSDFFKKYDDYIFERINSERTILYENLFVYGLTQKLEDFCKFIINENYNLINICNDLITFHKFNDINECIKKILSDNNNDQNKLINLKNEKGITIYHLLANIQNNLFFCKNLENHKISNLFDDNGNTPMYYACQNLNIIFIETFSHYSFNLSENNSNTVNYSLFLETKNSKTPLEILYDKLNKEDENIIKLIIDISINMRIVYIIPIIKYLIKSYSPHNNRLFTINIKRNFSSINYLNKIIGLYQFYTKELNGSIMIKDEFGNDPFFICALDNNYNFLFNILLEEHNICLNSTNNEGKSIIHIIVEISGYLNTYKLDILKNAIESGFDFNIKDKENMLPIDYAYLDNDYNIINMLIEYYNAYGMPIPEKKNLKPNNKIIYNFCKDSDYFYNQSISVSTKIDNSENLNELVSSSFNYDSFTSFYQVCFDQENEIPFSANLVKKDFTNFDENKDKKYCIQLLNDTLKENNMKSKYLLITVENEIVQKKIPFSDLNLAKLRFKEMFKEKTNNDWNNVKNNKSNFKNNYLKYYIFDYSYEEENAIYEYLKQTIKYLYIEKKIEYNGNNKIQNLIYYLLVKSYQNKFSIDDQSLNVEQKTKEIIKKYKSTAVRKAFSILLEIKNEINGKNKDEIHFKKMAYLINSYNDLIPYSHNSNDYSLFNNTETIDNEISRLTTYYYIENVLKLFLGAIYNLKTIHPIDYIINALGCKIEEVKKPQNTEELITEEDYIYNYLYSTGGKNYQISSVYKISQSIYDKNFNLNNFQNRYIFCHGTKIENVLGILSQGLKNAPVQAVITGKVFGSGIYLSDSFSFSLMYCYPLNRKNYDQKAFMFLVEAAVGTIGENGDTKIAKMDLNFDDAFTTNEGYKIFKNSNNIQNGAGIIVVHDETNVRIKYLVEIN